MEARACALRGVVFNDETSCVARSVHTVVVSRNTHALVSCVAVYVCLCLSLSPSLSLARALPSLACALPPCARLVRVCGCLFGRACAEVVRVRQTPRWQRDGGERRARGPPKTVSEVPRLFCRHRGLPSGAFLVRRRFALSPARSHTTANALCCRCSIGPRTGPTMSGSCF